MLPWGFFPSQTYNNTFTRSWKCCSTWLAPLLVPICRLMVVLSMGGWIWALGSYKCLLVPYALMPAWLAHLLVPIWEGKSEWSVKQAEIGEQLGLLSCWSSWIPLTSARAKQKWVPTCFAEEYLTLLSSAHTHQQHYTPEPVLAPRFKEWNRWRFNKIKTNRRETMVARRLTKAKYATLAHLQADDALPRLHLLLIKRPLLLVCIFHSDVDLCLAAFSLGLAE